MAVLPWHLRKTNCNMLKIRIPTQDIQQQFTHSVTHGNRITATVLGFPLGTELEVKLEMEIITIPLAVPPNLMNCLRGITA